MPDRIKIKKITFKDQWVNIISEDGKAYSGNSTYAGAEGMLKWKDGDEVEVNVKDSNGKYYISIPKPAGAGKTFAPKDVSHEKRIAALTNAVNSVKQIEGKITSEQVLALAEKYLTFLNQR